MTAPTGDTTPDAQREYTGMLRRLGMTGRARMVFDLSDSLRGVLEAGVRHRHPEYDEDQVRLAALRLAVGEELFGRAFPGVEVTP